MLKKRHFIMSLALLLTVSLWLAACTSTVAPPAEQPAETGGEEPAEPPVAAEPTDEPAPAERKVATFIFTQEFDTLSPLYTGMWFSTITAQIWNAWAWNFDHDNNPVPVLLTELPSEENGGITDEGRVLTFNLRDDINWSDGTPITADDFVFTYEMIVDPNNVVQSTYPYDLISSVEASDPTTVVVTFEEPFAPWLASLWRGLLPAHVLRPVYEAEGTLDNAAWNLAPTVSAGPYVFADWESGSFARFVRNENYYDSPPKIDEIFIRFVPDDASQVAALKTGEGDLGTFIAYSDVPSLEEAGVEIVTQPSGYNEGWFFYLGEGTHPALQDVRVRQAIAMGFDRFTLNQDLLLGLTKPPSTLWDNMPYVDPSLSPWPYDPEAAKALLDEAGWVDSNGDGVRDKDGVELVLVHGTTIREIRQDAQAVAQQQLAEIGIRLETQSFDPNVLFAGYGDDGPAATGQLDIFEWSDGPSYPDPDHYYWYCSEIPSAEYPDGGNWQALCDEDLDGLFTLQATQTNAADRTETFHRITRHMYDNVYWLGLWEDPDVWALSGRLTGYRLSGATPFYNITEWDIQN